VEDLADCDESITHVVVMFQHGCEEKTIKN
jgi:hypothetical protein